MSDDKPGSCTMLRSVKSSAKAGLFVIPLGKVGGGFLFQMRRQSIVVIHQNFRRRAGVVVDADIVDGAA